MGGRGNNRSHWYAEGGYDPIAEKLFASLQVDRFLLEYDDERSGTFEPLRFVPRGKTVVLGLVSSKLAELESSAELRRRIEAAARYVPLDDLARSPQCGFASTMEGPPSHRGRSVGEARAGRADGARGVALALRAASPSSSWDGLVLRSCGRLFCR
jgi:Cobalamin-independent synthase, Catalytic domain